MLVWSDSRDETRSLSALKSSVDGWFEFCTSANAAAIAAPAANPAAKIDKVSPCKQNMIESLHHILVLSFFTK